MISKQILLFAFLSVCAFSAHAMMDVKPKPFYSEHSLPSLGNANYFNTALNLLFCSGFSEKVIGAELIKLARESDASFEKRKEIQQSIKQIYLFHVGERVVGEREDNVASRDLYHTNLIQEWNELCDINQRVAARIRFVTFKISRDVHVDLGKAFHQLMSVLGYPKSSVTEIFTPADPQADDEAVSLLPKTFQTIYLGKADGEISLQEAIRNTYGDNIRESSSSAARRPAARFFSASVKELYLIVDDRQLLIDGETKKSKASLVFNLQRPLVVLPLTDGIEVTWKLMRVNAVAFHDGVGISESAYKMSHIVKDQRGRSMWVTHDSTGTYSGVDGQRMSTGAHVFHLVSADEQWLTGRKVETFVEPIAYSISGHGDGLDKDYNLGLGEEHYEVLDYDAAAHGQIKRIWPAGNDGVIMYTSKKEFVFYENGVFNVIAKDFSLTDAAVIGDDLFIITQTGSLAKKDIRTRELMWPLKNREWAHVKRMISVADFLVTFDAAGNLRRWLPNDFTHSSIMAEGWDPESMLERINSSSIISVTPQLNVKITNAFNLRTEKFGDYRWALPVKNAVMFIENGAISMIPNPRHFVTPH